MTAFADPPKTWVKTPTGYFPKDMLDWMISRGYKTEILAYLTVAEVEECLCREYSPRTT